MTSRRSTCRTSWSRAGISCPSSTTSSISRRSRRGTWSWSAADFDLPSAIENALILVRERASRRGITLGSTIDERLGVIGGDERKVKQVLLNLLSNALKFTPEGGRIDVGAPAARRGGGGVRHGYGHRHRAGGSGGGVRGVSAGGCGGEESGRHRARAGSLPEVRRAPWRHDLGAERARPRLDLHVHAPGWVWAGEPSLIVNDKEEPGPVRERQSAWLTIPPALLQRADQVIE